MTTERSTYTYKSGAQETVTLLRGGLTPYGCAILKITYSDGETTDCYVDLAWLRDRVNDLDPRPLTPDAITDEMVKRARVAWLGANINLTPDGFVREILTAALTEPPTRPEGAEEIEAYMRELVTSHPEDHYGELADHLASRGVLPPLTDKTHPEEQP